MSPPSHSTSGSSFLNLVYSLQVLPGQERIFAADKEQSQYLQWVLQDAFPGYFLWGEHTELASCSRAHTRFWSKPNSSLKYKIITIIAIVCLLSKQRPAGMLTEMLIPLIEHLFVLNSPNAVALDSQKFDKSTDSSWRRADASRDTEWVGAASIRHRPPGPASVPSPSCSTGNEPAPSP